MLPLVLSARRSGAILEADVLLRLTFSLCHLRTYDTFTVHRNNKKFPTGDLLGLDRLDVNERFAQRNGGGVPCFVSKPVRSGKGRAGPKSPSASGISTKISGRGGYECSTTTSTEETRSVSDTRRGSHAALRPCGSGVWYGRKLAFGVSAQDMNDNILYHARLALAPHGPTPPFPS